MESWDSIIVGGGPAGLSAAIYLARFNRTVLVIDDGSGRSTTHEITENYLGFPDGIPSKQLRELGRRQAERFGAEFRGAHVERVERTDAGFRVTTDGGPLAARTIILATGVRDIFPEFEGTQDYVGKSLFWCITCDGHKTRGKRVVIAGNDDEAAVTCLQFLNFTDRLTFVTNQPAGELGLTDQGLRRLEGRAIPLYEGRITGVEGSNGYLSAVQLDTGARIQADMLFSHQGCEPKNELAAQLGVALSPTGFVEVDVEQRTRVPGFYAAGDLTRPFAHQAVTAAHEGATAGTTANYDLYAPDQKEG